jgi:nucleoside-diphosphate-sugar epimerase
MLKQGTRVLVTGGAGFIGSHVSRALTAAGCHVRVLDDLSTGKRERLYGLGSRLDLMHADIRNSTAVEKAAKGANVIIHLAGTPVGADPMRAQEVNLGGTLNVLGFAKAAERSERPRVILAGSGAVYGKQPAFVLHEELPPRPALPQAVMALAAENYGRVFREAYGVPVTNLRIFRTFGPDEDPERADSSIVAKLIRCALDGTSPVIQGDGQQTRDLVYVDNVVSAMVAAAEHDVGAEPLNIASGEAVAINFLWTLVLELLGKKRLVIEPTYVPALPWDPKHARPQIQRSCKVLGGWAPSVRLREALHRTVKHYLDLRSADPNAWFAPKEDSGSQTLPRRPTRPPMTPSRTTNKTPPPLPTQNSSATSTAARTPIPARPTPTPTRTPTPVPPPIAEVVELDAEMIVESESSETSLSIETVNGREEFDIEWAPVPAVPGMGR